MNQITPQNLAILSWFSNCLHKNTSCPLIKRVLNIFCLVKISETENIYHILSS